MAKPNYSYAKRQRELAKKKKKEEKRRKKSGVLEDPNVEPGADSATDPSDETD